VLIYKIYSDSTFFFKEISTYESHAELWKLSNNKFKFVVAKLKKNKIEAYNFKLITNAKKFFTMDKSKEKLLYSVTTHHYHYNLT
jgi:hypothetical protein